MHIPLRPLVPALALATLTVTAACGDDAASPTVAGEAAAEGGDGTILFHLEETEGILIEGFELGVRFTAGGEVVKAVDWNDFVAESGAADPEAAYTTVLEQPVPAGTVLVEVDFRTSIGGPIEPVDLEAEAFPCSLEVEVPAGGEVEVELALTSEPGCLTVVER